MTFVTMHKGEGRTRNWWSSGSPESWLSYCTIRTHGIVSPITYLLNWTKPACSPVLRSRYLLSTTQGPDKVIVREINVNTYSVVLKFRIHVIYVYDNRSICLQGQSGIHCGLGESQVPLPITLALKIPRCGSDRGNHRGSIEVDDPGIAFYRGCDTCPVGL